MADRTQEVFAAAARLVAAFGTHRTEDYFACFAPDATFVFHTHPEVLANRQAYRDLWSGWELDGFRVLGCRSLDGAVSMLGDDHAVFTHRVRTRLAVPACAVGASAVGGSPPAGSADAPAPDWRPVAGPEQAERESIVFARTTGGQWLAVHEHLSPDPQANDEAAHDDEEG